MQFLSALTSTTSPLAMQAMPAIATPTADFASLLAGMVPGEAVAVPAAAPDTRQIAALPGNGLPVPVAAPDVATATPLLPVSATEAVSMLPAELAEPKVVVPVVAAAAVAAMGTLATLLPDEETPPPEPEKLAVPVLPTPPRFAVPLPRGRKLEAEAPRERPAEESDDSDADGVVADAVPLPVQVVVPDVVVAADRVVIENAVVPAPVLDAGVTPTGQTILEDGSIVATEPTTPMRPAKRSTACAADAAVSTPVTPTVPQAVAAVPGAPPATASVGVAMPVDAARSPVVAAADGCVSQRAEPVAMASRSVSTVPVAPVEQAPPVAPAIGRVLPLQADGVVPVHVVVPQRSDDMAAAAPLATAPASDRFDSAESGAPVARPLPLAEAVVRPVASVAVEPMPTGVAGAVRASLETIARVQPQAAIPIVSDTTVAVPADVASEAAIIAAATSATVRPARAGSLPLAETPVEVASIDRPVLARDADIVRQPVVASNDTLLSAANPAPIAASNTMTAAAPQTVATPAPVARDAAPIIMPPVASSAPLPGIVTPTPLEPSIGTTSRLVADVRQPIAGEAAAPVVSVAAPAEPVVRPAPVTRIAMPTPSAESVAALAIVDAAAPPPRARREDDAATLPTAAAAIDPVVLRPVAAPVQAGQPMLDTRQPQWMEGMIDRIETLRESAGTNGETRIRLSPDALGDVEIAIRTSDDGKVHVHFNSENADAGRLLADAQPRLVQLAEARGLKLGGMQVDVGTQQQSQRQAQDHGNAAPRAPRSAANGTNAQSSTNDNQRIA